MRDNNVGRKPLPLQFEHDPGDFLSGEHAILVEPDVVMCAVGGDALGRIVDAAHAGDVDVLALGDERDVVTGLGKRGGKVPVLSGHVLVHEEDAHGCGNAL